DLDAVGTPDPVTKLEPGGSVRLEVQARPRIGERGRGGAQPRRYLLADAYRGGQRIAGEGVAGLNPEDESVQHVGRPDGGGDDGRVGHEFTPAAATVATGSPADSCRPSRRMTRARYGR